MILLKPNDYVRLKSNYEDVLNQIEEEHGWLFKVNCYDWLEQELIKPHRVYRVLRADHKVLMIDHIAPHKYYHRRELFHKVVLPKRTKSTINQQSTQE
jgi:hypothetical protein